MIKTVCNQCGKPLKAGTATLAVRMWMVTDGGELRDVTKDDIDGDEPPKSEAGLLTCGPMCLFNVALELMEAQGAKVVRMGDGIDVTPPEGECEGG